MKTHRVKESPSFLLKIILLTFIPLVVVIGHVYKFQSLMTFVYIPALFLLSLHLNNYKLSFSKPIKYYLIFFVSTLLSAITATYLDLFINETKTALGCILFGFTLYNFIIYSPKTLKYILISYILTTYFLSAYLFINDALNVASLADDKYRVEDEVFNANKFSYYIYLALFAFYFLFEIYKSKVVWLIYFLSLLLYVVVIFASASRGGLIIFLLVNALYWIFIGFVNKPKIIKPALVSLLIVLFCLPFMQIGYEYFLEETNIGYRFENLANEGEDTARMVILNVAMDCFLSNPILGVGSGNFAALNYHRIFSHNSFAELLANNGIFACLLYLASLVALVNQTFVQYKNSYLATDRKVLAVILLYIATFLIYSFFYVFVLFLPYTGFVFVLFAIANVQRSRTSLERINF